MLHPGASIRPAIVNRFETPPSGVPSGLSLKRASRTGPFAVMNHGTLLAPPASVASATCGLSAGEVPPVAGCAWHELQLFPLNLGPRPGSVSGTNFSPITDCSSLNSSNPAPKNFDSRGVMPGSAPPAPDGPGRTPGSVAANAAASGAAADASTRSRRHAPTGARFAIFAVAMGLRVMCPAAQQRLPAPRAATRPGARPGRAAARRASPRSRAGGCARCAPGSSSDPKNPGGDPSPGIARGGHPRSRKGMTNPSTARVPSLTIRGVETAAVEAPMTFALGTSAAIVRRAPLLLVDLETEEGITGRTYLFCYRPSVPRAIDAVLRDAVSAVKGERVAPLDLGARLARRFALVGVASVVRMALSALDAALWDALAVAAGLPLATLLGAKPRPIPAYNSSGRALMAEGIAWLEEPIRHDDYAGNAAVARALAVPVQIGENFNGPEGMVEALGAGACDYVMPDAARIGGVSGWIQAAGIAAAHRIEMSSHLLPELSAHLLAATPTCHWLEWVDWANAILEEPLQIQDGCARVPDRPGTGLAWRADAVEALSLGR